MLLQRYSLRKLQNYMNLLHEIWEYNFPGEKEKELIVDEFFVGNLLAKYPALRDINMFRAVVKKSIQYYKNKYPYFLPSLSHIFSDKVLPVILKKLEQEDKVYFSLPESFTPLLYTSPSDHIMNKREAFKIYYLATLLNQSKEFSYFPSTLIALEKLMFYTLKEKPTFLNPDLSEIIQTIIQAHNKYLDIRDSGRDEKKWFKKAHYSKCFVRKQKIKVLNKGFTFWECVRFFFSPDFQLRKLGVIIPALVSDALGEKLRNYVIRYRPYLWILPHTNLVSVSQAEAYFKHYLKLDVEIVPTVLKKSND